jgi:hypothetical protein
MPRKLHLCTDQLYTIYWWKIAEKRSQNGKKENLHIQNKRRAEPTGHLHQEEVWPHEKGELWASLQKVLSALYSMLTASLQQLVSSFGQKFWSPLQQVVSSFSGKLWTSCQQIMSAFAGCCELLCSRLWASLQQVASSFTTNFELRWSKLLEKAEIWNIHSFHKLQYLIYD